MGLQNETIRALSSVTAELNYLAPLAERPRTYAYDLPAGEPRTNTVPEPHLLPIHDARAINGIVSLDTTGFSLVKHQSRVQDFYDDEEVKKVYYGEAEALLKSFTGAHRVVVFDHTVRNRVEGAADSRGNGPRQPVGRVHVDHTAKSGPQCRLSISGARFVGR
jgi:hypothetical protein